MKRRRSPLFLAFIGMAFLLFACGVFPLIWKPLLEVSEPLQRADALIVLGGESRDRPRTAARLYVQGIAPRIFVTGEGDAMRIRQRLMEEGVSPEAIIVEKRALTTYTNATLLKPVLLGAGVRTAVIVTSPFHARRALATFRHVIPSISFGVSSAPSTRWSRTKSDWMALLEILKILEYRIFYGIPLQSPVTP